MDLRVRITATATHLLDGIASSGEVDLMEAFATPLPFTVICELLGIPTDDRRRVQGWLRALESADFADSRRIPAIAQALSGCLSTLAADKRQRHDDDLFSALVAAADAGEFATEQVPALVFLLLAAGHETTANLIGNGVLALLGERTQWMRLCADPARAALVVEEVLRLESPLETATIRYATAEIVIDDVTIRAGDLVLIGLAAANRDPSRFPEPARLDTLREEASGHLAFGHGIHTCIGAGLARLEGEIALLELARRFPDLALAVPKGEIQWKPGLITRGLHTLPVRTRPQAETTSDFPPGGSSTQRNPGAGPA
jgi:cytochrome P450